MFSAQSIVLEEDVSQEVKRKRPFRWREKPKVSFPLSLLPKQKVTSFLPTTFTAHLLVPWYQHRTRMKKTLGNHCLRGKMAPKSGLTMKQEKVP
jgi:hypothetical protein